VTRVRFRLHPAGKPTLKYAELRARFAEASPTLAEVARVVREIRHGKGMLLVEGETDCRSAGSFFKNPVVSLETLSQVRAAAEGAEVPHWPTGEGTVKLPAAWLLEKAGFIKGYGDGPVGISSRHTLALVNRGGATFADVERMEHEIVDRVRAKFGVELQREPVVV
jgi:UDP-N-acetylmuramate dehydrogenase